MWADEAYGLYAITDPGGNLIEGQTAAGVAWPPAMLDTTDRMALSLWEGIAVGPVWNDENYGIPFTDSNGDIIFGVRKDGSVDIPKLNVATSALNAADAAALTFLESLFVKGWDEVYGFSITDSNGNLLLGIEHNGAVDMPGLSPSESVWWPFIDTNGTLGRLEASGLTTGRAFSASLIRRARVSSRRRPTL